MAARRGRPTAPVELSGEERQTLERMGTPPLHHAVPGHVRRARIVLACAEGKTNQAVAREVGTSAKQTVCKWRGRFQRDRLMAGLADEYRWEYRPPRSLARWSKRVLNTSRPWRRSRGTPRTGRRGGWPSKYGAIRGAAYSASGIRSNFHKPHRTDTFKISQRPAVRVGRGPGHHRALSGNPPEAAAVLCVDQEKLTDPSPGTAPNPFCRCDRELPRATYARRLRTSMAPPPSSPPSTWPVAR